MSTEQTTDDAGTTGDAQAGSADAADAAEARNRARGAESLPGIDFSTLLLSLSTSVFVHLGQAPSPEGQTTKNIPLAKQTIDIIEMLQKKTKGNLLDEETELLTQLLYDLRLRYVAAIK
ncbi:MAG: DUF1844 domain-containing protein [Deltaproteobacteria bacterium]|nr:DUF1844 domain-containing protein [Deltaproteobacteria bacterium]